MRKRNHKTEVALAPQGDEVVKANPKPRPKALTPEELAEAQRRMYGD